MTSSPDATRSLPDLTLQTRGKFRALLGMEGSLAQAARRVASDLGDPARACEEMTREHMTVTFLETKEALDSLFPEDGPEDDIAARERTQIALGLQRAAILMRRSRALQAVADQDDHLRFEVDEDRRILEAETLEDEQRRSIQQSILVNEICRTDLRALARVVLERTAILEALATRPDDTLTAETLEDLCTAAEMRLAPVQGALDEGASLRQALAADLALANAPVQVPVSPSPTTPNRATRVR